MRAFFLLLIVILALLDLVAASAKRGSVVPNPVAISCGSCVSWLNIRLYPAISDQIRPYKLTRHGKNNPLSLPYALVVPWSVVL